MLKYFRRREKRKLYRQWVERSGLSPDAIPREEAAEERISPKHKQLLHVHAEDKQQSRLYILYILLGVSLVILCAGLILLIVHSS